MLRPSSPRCASIPIAFLFILVLSAPSLAPAREGKWSFAISGDSRNCGDFVMPAIAAKVKAEKDAFYWHLGDFRWMSEPDQDLIAMEYPANTLTLENYHKVAWDDFLTHQMAAFGSFPVFLGRGNHETVPPMTREGYVAKFAPYLDRSDVEAQRVKDGEAAAPVGPWYHWTKNGVDFITLDNASKEEFTDAQLHWLRGVLDRDLAPNSGIQAIVAGMHEALPHSTGAEHAMDDWDRGRQTGEQVYGWFHDAQAAGKHVYLIASHSHYYSPDIFNAPYWVQHLGTPVPGWIIGTAGARRYKLPPDAHAGAKTHIYGFMRGTVHQDGTIDFKLQELSEKDLDEARWPNAPASAIHECYVDNAVE